jgi:hypothetical protein
MINLIRWLSASHLSKWAKGYYWHAKVCVLRWPSQWNRQGMKIKKTKDKVDDFTFPIVNVPFITGNIPAWPARCVVCTSTYGFWIPHWYLQTLLPLNQVMYTQTATVKNGHIRQVVAKYKFISYEMHCERNLKLKPDNTSYCLIEVVTKAGSTVA